MTALVEEKAIDAAGRAWAETGPGTVLVLATVEPVAELLGELNRHLGDGRDVLVVAPALASHVGFWTDDDRWRPRAVVIARDTVAEIAAAGISVRGRVGDADPLEALDDALRTENVVDLIVMGSASDCANWFERDLVAQARQRYDIPFTVLPGSVGAPCPWREASRWGGRATIILAFGVLLALVLGLSGAGETWLVGELALVLGIVAADIAAHLAIVGGLAWLALGPLASRRSARTKRKTPSPI